MPLPLRAYSGRYADFAVVLDLHLGAFVRPDAGALDVTNDADTDMAALCAQPRLLFSEEMMVADHFQRLVEDLLVIAAVIGERREILIDDLVVVGKRFGRNEIAPPDLGAVDIEFTRGNVEKPLNDEDTVLTAGAAVRRDNRFVGEDRTEGAVVIRDDVRPEQRTLAVDRHRQAIRVIGAGVVQENVLDAEDTPVGRKRNFRIVSLAAFMRGGEEMLEAVLDPLHWAVELHRRPRNHHLLRIEQHD